MNAKPRRSIPPPAEEIRSGFVALVGRPNVGKSTLMNALVGQTIAIATPCPQTTRTRIRGILNRPGSQIILVDTPGIHRRDVAINRFMLIEAQTALSEVDAAVVMVEAGGRGGGAGPLEDEDELVLDSLRKAGVPALLVINKIDTLKDMAALLPTMDRYGHTGLFAEIIPLCALRADGLEALLQALERLLPAGPRYYPEDLVTDQTERHLVAELIREQVIRNTAEEIPYSVAVEILTFEEQADRKLVRIAAVLFVERNSQKGILIGKGGQRLKAIGTAARRAIEDLLQSRVHLDLRVKVARQWAHSEAGLREVGYRRS
jgi:GTP-binding protein Era